MTFGSAKNVAAAWLLGAGCFAGFTIATQTAAAAGACTSTTRAADSACASQTEADFFIAVGKCRNVPNATAREACLDRARGSRSEALELCEGQLAARQQLCGLLGEAPYAPRIDPANFVPTITNPFMPFVPGTRLIYRGQTEDGVERIVVTVTDQKETILGVECTVVRDTVTLDGEVVEDTLDWFAQDLQGNVWYFGEISKSFENGDLVSLGGSWRAGVEGARPGIVMPGSPQVGDVYRQEFLLGEAEDYARILTLDGNATVPAASCNDCLVTRDKVPLEPDANERKFYKQDVGLILEIDDETGDRIELIRIDQP